MLPTLVGDTPGTSSARSRKLRPLSGRLDLGLRDRAGDLAARRLEDRGLAGDGDAGVEPADASATGSSNAEPTVSAADVWS